jgi:O-succinylbenzoic acid--CoA ligase
MVVEGWLARAAGARGDRTAVQTPAESWSYAELLARARVGAQQLTARGVCPGQRVAIALPPGLAFAQALHACLLLGAVAVPVDVRAPAAERARLAEETVAQIDEPLAGPGAGTVAAQLDLAAGSTHDLDAIAVVIHTSGTTSSPRPVELSYGNVLWSALGSAVALGVDPRERWLCALPVSHVGGLSIMLRSAIYATTAVVHERFYTDRMLQALREQEITLVSLVATTLARLLDAGLEGPPALRCALTGGGPVPEKLVQRAQAAGVPVSLTYGLTEACSQVTTTPVAALRPHESQGAGQPLFCTRVRIGAPAPAKERGERGEIGADAEIGAGVGIGAEAEIGAEVDIGPEGEIMVSGPTVARASLDRDGWLHTGDEGSLEESGRLRVSGRRADTIISGGENVAPAEVEAVLETHPEVLEAAVLGRADERWGEAVTAIVVARPGRTPDRDALRAHCALALAPHKVPKQVVLTAGRLPRTPSGKLLRRELG